MDHHRLLGPGGGNPPTKRAKLDSTTSDTSGSGHRLLTQPRELEPHGTGIDLTPPSTAQLQGATQPEQMQSHVMAFQQREVVPPEVHQPSYIGPLYGPLPGVSWIQPQLNPIVIQPISQQVTGGDHQIVAQY